MGATKVEEVVTAVLLSLISEILYSRILRWNKKRKNHKVFHNNNTQCISLCGYISFIDFWELELFPLPSLIWTCYIIRSCSSQSHLPAIRMYS